MISYKPTSGKSARFHLFEYRLVTRHNFRVAHYSPRIRNRSVRVLRANASMALMDFRKPRYWWMCSDLLFIFNL